MRISQWLIGGSLVATAGTAGAAPCDEIADKTVAFVIGVDLADQLKVVGGMEGRACVGERGEAMFRMEFGHGSPRLIGGFRVHPFFDENEDPDRENVGIEGGAVIDSEGGLGAHLALSYGSHSAYGAVQTFAPLTGAARPARFTLLGGLAPWTMFEGEVVEGRPLTIGGRIVRPGVRKLPEVKGREAKAVRDHFVAAAQMEYSSVWTFVRLARELAAVGAPARLVAAALRAAEDEIRHARMCAQAAGGAELVRLAISAARPRFLMRSAQALAVLAAEAWCEGCLNEGAAAEEARMASAEAQGENRRMLAQIARDEASHAALSWEVLTWIAQVAPAVAVAAIESLPASAGEGRGPWTDAALLRHGVPSAEIAAAARAAAGAAARRKLAELRG